MHRKDVIQRIIDAAKADSKIQPKSGEAVQPGQIRLLSNADRGRGGQIVVIAKVEPWAETAEVILLNNLVELATTRDFVSLSQTSENTFDAVVWADFYGTVDFMQLSDNPVLGTLCNMCVDSLYVSSQNPDGDIAHPYTDHSCLKAGKHKLQLNEEIWHLRNTEFANFYEKTIHLSEIQIAARQARNVSFKQVEFRADLLRNSSHSQLTDEAIDALDDLTLCLVRM